MPRDTPPFRADPSEQEVAKLRLIVETAEEVWVGWPLRSLKSNDC